MEYNCKIVIIIILLIILLLLIYYCEYYYNDNYEELTLSNIGVINSLEDRLEGNYKEYVDELREQQIERLEKCGAKFYHLLYLNYILTITPCLFDDKITELDRLAKEERLPTAEVDNLKELERNIQTEVGEGILVNTIEALKGILDQLPATTTDDLKQIIKTETNIQTYLKKMKPFVTNEEIQDYANYITECKGVIDLSPPCSYSNLKGGDIKGKVRIIKRTLNEYKKQYMSDDDKRFENDKLNENSRRITIDFRPMKNDLYYPIQIMKPKYLSNDELEVLKTLDGDVCSTSSENGQDEPDYYTQSTPPILTDQGTGRQGKYYKFIFGADSDSITRNLETCLPSSHPPAVGVYNDNYEKFYNFDGGRSVFGSEGVTADGLGELSLINGVPTYIAKYNVDDPRVDKLYNILKKMIGIEGESTEGTRKLKRIFPHFGKSPVPGIDVIKFRKQDRVKWIDEGLEKKGEITNVSKDQDKIYIQLIDTDGSITSDKTIINKSDSVFNTLNVMTKVLTIIFDKKWVDNHKVSNNSIINISNGDLMCKDTIDDLIDRLFWKATSIKISMWGDTIDNDAQMINPEDRILDNTNKETSGITLKDIPALKLYVEDSRWNIEKLISNGIHIINHPCRIKLVEDIEIYIESKIDHSNSRELIGSAGYADIETIQARSGKHGETSSVGKGDKFQIQSMEDIGGGMKEALGCPKIVSSIGLCGSWLRKDIQVEDQKQMAHQLMIQSEVIKKMEGKDNIDEYWPDKKFLKRDYCNALRNTTICGGSGLVNNPINYGTVGEALKRWSTIMLYRGKLITEEERRIKQGRPNLFMQGFDVFADYTGITKIMSDDGCSMESGIYGKALGLDDDLVQNWIINRIEPNNPIYKDIRPPFLYETLESFKGDHSDIVYLIPNGYNTYTINNDNINNWKGEHVLYNDKYYAIVKDTTNTDLVNKKIKIEYYDNYTGDLKIEVVNLSNVSLCFDAFLDLRSSIRFLSFKFPDRKKNTLLPYNKSLHKNLRNKQTINVSGGKGPISKAMWDYIEGKDPGWIDKQVLKYKGSFWKLTQQNLSKMKLKELGEFIEKDLETEKIDKSFEHRKSEIKKEYDNIVNLVSIAVVGGERAVVGNRETLSKTIVKLLKEYEIIDTGFELLTTGLDLSDLTKLYGCEYHEGKKQLTCTDRYESLKKDLIMRIIIVMSYWDNYKYLHYNNKGPKSLLESLIQTNLEPTTNVQCKTEGFRKLFEFIVKTIGVVVSGGIAPKIFKIGSAAQKIVGKFIKFSMNHVYRRRAGRAINLKVFLADTIINIVQIAEFSGELSEFRELYSEWKLGGDAAVRKTLAHAAEEEAKKSFIERVEDDPHHLVGKAVDAVGESLSSKSTESQKQRGFEDARGAIEAREKAKARRIADMREKAKARIAAIKAAAAQDNVNEGFTLGPYLNGCINPPIPQFIIEKDFNNNTPIACNMAPDEYLYTDINII